MKIAVAGTGNVGLSNTILLTQHNEVVTVDIIKEKVELLNDRIYPVKDTEIANFLSKNSLNFTATLDADSAYSVDVKSKVFTRDLFGGDK